MSPRVPPARDHSVALYEAALAAVSKLIVRKRSAIVSARMSAAPRPASVSPSARISLRTPARSFILP